MSGMLYENYQPDGAGMSKKQARRSAIISGMPSSQMEVAAQAAKEDFQNRTLATKQQAYADQQANIVGGIGGMAKLAGTQYKNRALDDKQAQRLQDGQPQKAPAPQPAANYGVGGYNPMTGPRQPMTPMLGEGMTDTPQSTSEDDLLMELMRMLYGGAY